MKLGIERYRYKPIIIVMIYSLVTIYLFEFGVVNFQGYDKFTLYLFLFFAHMGMLFGYFYGMNSKSCSPGADAKDGKALLHTLFKYSFVICLITFIPNYMVQTHNFTFTLSDMTSKIQVGLANSSELYNANRDVENVSGIWKIINIGLVLTGFARWTFFPLSVYLWNELKNYHKIFFFIFAAFYLASFLATGTTAGIFTISFITIVPFVMKTSRQKCCFEMEYKRKQTNKRTKIISYGAILGGISASLWIFGNNMDSRMGWDNDNIITTGWSSLPWSVVPDSLRPATYWLTGYLAQGYNALSYCIDLPFTSTFGLGGSWFLMDNFSSLLNINILQYTYLDKAEQFGIGAYHNWHTVYVWIANDVSFFGVPIVLFVLFYLMAQSWRDYLVNNDPFAFIFMTIMGFFCLYISANNTVFTHSDTLFAFWIILFAWKRYKGIYRYDQQLAEATETRNSWTTETEEVCLKGKA